MNNDTDGGTVQESQASSLPTDDNNSSQEQIETQEKIEPSVPRSTYTRVSNDMHKYKKTTRELQNELAELKEAQLREKQEYKQLWEQSKADVDKWKSKATSNEDLFWNTQKFNDVSRVALETGLRPEAIKDLELLDLKEVVIEKTDTGRFEVHGVKEFVESVKKDRPYWFQTEQAPKVNSGGGGARPDTDGVLTPQQMALIDRKFKTGQISQTEYYEMYERYDNQSKNKKLLE